MRSDGEERGAAFLKIFEPVFEAYQRQLGQRIDFEDMIARATRHVKSGRYRSPYRHLLVDEFQDISKGRADLLRALKEQHGDARIFAVGDDWQSIYRFTGSDIHLMRNFGEEFGGKFAAQSGIHRSVDLGRTFRNVEAIAIPACDFVLKNPDQIEKEVIPAGTCEAPTIRVAWTGKGRDASVLGKLLNEISRQQTASEKKTASVLLLGRYRHSRPANLKILEKNHPGLSIRFKTIHASKGLEADHVIVLGAGSGRWGLPSEVADDPVLGLALPPPELFPHAEERRVFYVALTRARLSVTVVASTDRPSAFVTELLENRDCGVAEIGGPGLEPPLCTLRRPSDRRASGDTKASFRLRTQTSLRRVSSGLRGLRQRLAGAKRGRSGLQHLQLRRPPARLFPMHGRMAGGTARPVRELPRVREVPALQRHEKIRLIHYITGDWK